MPSPRTPARLTTRAFLLAVGLLIVAEGVVRLFFSSSMSGRFDYGYNPTAGFVERADGTVSLERSGGRRFFPQRFPVQPPPTTYRVMVVGDSVPRGSSLESSYARQLGSLFASEGALCEAWNLAVPGYGVRRVQVVLRQALRYHPSLVVLHVNDSNEYEDEREWRRSREFQGWHPRNWLMKSLVFRRLYEARTEKVSWELLPEAVRGRQGVNDADAEIAASMNPARLAEWGDRVRTVTRESVRLCTEAGVPVVLVTQARRTRLADGRLGLDDGGLDAFAQSLTNRTVAWVAMSRVFRDADLATTYADGSHVRPPAHQALARALRDTGLLESRRAARAP
jgi:hypothetical protein